MSGGGRRRGRGCSQMRSGWPRTDSRSARVWPRWSRAMPSALRVSRRPVLISCPGASRLPRAHRLRNPAYAETLRALASTARGLLHRRDRGGYRRYGAGCAGQSGGADETDLAIYRVRSGPRSACPIAVSRSAGWGRRRRGRRPWGRSSGCSRRSIWRAWARRSGGVAADRRCQPAGLCRPGALPGRQRFRAGAAQGAAGPGLPEIALGVVAGGRCTAAGRAGQAGIRSCAQLGRRPIHRVALDLAYLDCRWLWQRAEHDHDHRERFWLAAHGAGVSAQQRADGFLFRQP